MARTLTDMRGRPKVCSLCHGVGHDISRHQHKQALPRKVRPISERFWRHVDKSGECWIWTGAHQPFGKAHGAGYGNMNLGSGRYAPTHRVSWELHNGPIPNGLWVLHRCDNPKCVRPEHLFLGTQRDNARDMMKKRRGRGQFVTLSHCAKGHPMFGENLYTKPNGARRCRTCHRDENKMRREKSAQAVAA